MISAPIAKSQQRIGSADSKKDQINHAVPSKESSSSPPPPPAPPKPIPLATPMATPLVSAEGQLIFGTAAMPGAPPAMPVPATMDNINSSGSNCNGNNNNTSVPVPAIENAKNGVTAPPLPTPPSGLTSGVKRMLLDKNVATQKPSKKHKASSGKGDTKTKRRGKKQCNFSLDQVSILKNWFMTNIDDPYPGPQIKQELCARTGLSWKQVSDWFQNARCRAWPKKNAASTSSTVSSPMPAAVAPVRQGQTGKDTKRNTAFKDSGSRELPSSSNTQSTMPLGTNQVTPQAISGLLQQQQQLSSQQPTGINDKDTKQQSNVRTPISIQPPPPMRPLQSTLQGQPQLVPLPQNAQRTLQGSSYKEAQKDRPAGSAKDQLPTSSCSTSQAPVAAQNPQSHQTNVQGHAASQSKLKGHVQTHQASRGDKYSPTQSSQVAVIAAVPSPMNVQAVPSAQLPHKAFSPQTLSRAAGSQNAKMPTTDSTNNMTSMTHPTFTNASSDGTRIVKRRARLPRKAREMLGKWFNEHLRYPYPTSAEKEMLQKQTGLTPRQIFNWFTNRRKRDPNWKPSKSARSGEKHSSKRRAAAAAAATAANPINSVKNTAATPTAGASIAVKPMSTVPDVASLANLPPLANLVPPSPASGSSDMIRSAATENSGVQAPATKTVSTTMKANPKTTETLKATPASTSTPIAMLNPIPPPPPPTLSSSRTSNSRKKSVTELKAPEIPTGSQAVALAGKIIQQAKKAQNGKKKPDLGSEAELLLALAV